MKWLFKLSISALSVWCVWINNIVNADFCADRPCVPRSCGGESVVCVCDEYYYDTITRECGVPLGQYRSYVSSKCGLRFEKGCGSFCPVAEESDCITATLYPEEAFSSIKGFGTTITDAAAINWFSLPRNAREAMIQSYFGPCGLELNLIRTIIGGNDFSIRPYTYQDCPEYDECLSNFALANEDYAYKIPMINTARAVSCGKLKVLASCWSPPAWMKTNENLRGRGFLKPEYYQTYADYIYKYIDAYCKEGIPIWAVTTTNEPYNGFLGSADINCLGWTPECLGRWIADYLGPTLCKLPYDVAIICGDDQRYNLPIYVTEMIQQVPEVLKYLAGIAVHWYGNFISPASLFNYIGCKFPELFILSSEASEGFITGDVCLGSWTRAQNYASDIICDLNYNLVAWIDYNLCLDPNGGPNWTGNYADSPVIVFNEKKEFVKQPMFYAIGHFSKWIPRGSCRINIDYNPVECLELVAFRTPEQNIVVVLQNTACNVLDVSLIVGCQEIDICLVANSITTIEFPFCNEFFGVRRGYVRPCRPARCQLCHSKPYADCDCYVKSGGYGVYRPYVCCDTTDTVIIDTSGSGDVVVVT